MDGSEDPPLQQTKAGTIKIKAHSLKAVPLLRR